MPALTIQRKTLVAGSPTPIVPPYPCYGVKVGNASTDDLRVYTSTADLTQYDTIAAGYQEEYRNPGHHLFRGNEPALYLNALSGGQVVLTWI